MKYLIMCGGKYTEFEEPRHLTKVKGEELIARTIRLLQENHIKREDIWITSNNPIFDKFNLTRKADINNNYVSDGHHPNSVGGWWMDALYPMTEPCCYLFGDVFYSEEAIKLIVKTPCDDNILFGVIPTKNTLKKWKEPLALKIVNQVKLKKAITELKQMWLNRDPRLVRHPIVWEVFSQMNNLPFFPKLDCTKSKNFIGISDYSTDVDHPEDALEIEYFLAHGNITGFIAPTKKVTKTNTYIGGGYFGI